MLDDNMVPFPARSTHVERLAALRQVLDHLDSDLPQVIVEALADGANLVNAGMGALLDVEDDELHVAFSSDPSLVDLRVATLHDIEQTLGASDAITRRIRLDGQEWVLAFGARGGHLDRTTYLANEKTLVDVFVRLLRRRESEGGNRSYIDHLTGLPDRWATMGRIGEAFAAAARNKERAAVLFVDVNGFKQINDSFGHAQGDHVLKAIAGCMREVLRANEFVGRIGGDEFAVILPSIRAAQDAENVAQRLYDGVASLEIQSGAEPVTLGIGIAVHPDHAPTQEMWLHHADMAMYRAKRLRVPYCVYDGDRHYEDDAVVTKLSDYESAYSQQHLICFQPIFSVESRRVVAVEALIRWLHPNEGVLSAMNTVSAARKRQRTANLDLWVARKVLSYASRWQQYGIRNVHVNVSTEDDQELNALVRAISAAGPDAAALAIELPSPTNEDDSEKVRHFAEALEKTGARVGIDGFGSTSLSLTFLEKLPLNFVKLANNLLPSSGASGKGISAVVAMAQAMNWDVIATRVSTAEDRRAIRDAGVNAMQGYAFAQPMTAVDFEQWLENSQGVAFIV